MNLLQDLMQAAPAAPDHLKDDALRVLRREWTAIDPTVPVKVVEPYLTLHEAAQRLGFSDRSLWLWRVPGHDIGGRRRYRLSEISDYLASEDFKRRSAALRAERRHRLLAKAASKRPTPTTANP